MKLFWQYRLILFFIADRTLMLSGLTVSFLTKEPVYVALNKTLILKAQFEPRDVIRMVTWDRKTNSDEVRLATNTNPRDPRVSVYSNGQEIHISGVQNTDYGTYTVTVTDDNGIQKGDSIQVQNVGDPPVASLSLKCTQQSKGASWDSPTYSWWMDGISVTSNLSADSSMLYLGGRLANNYTCVVNSNQGTSRVQIIQAVKDPEQTPEPCSSNCNSALIAVVVIESMVLISGIGYFLLKFLRSRKNQ